MPTHIEYCLDPASALPADVEDHPDGVPVSEINHDDVPLSTWAPWINWYQCKKQIYFTWSGGAQFV